MMTLMGQMGQQQDFAKGLQMLRIAAEHADENAPQGAYVRIISISISISIVERLPIWLGSKLTCPLSLSSRSWVCFKSENYPRFKFPKSSSPTTKNKAD
jgi:hypothetical protein